MGQGKRLTWGIVATVRECPDLVACFAAHHAALGATELFIYLDKPDPEAQTLLSRIPGTIVTICDTAYWRSRGVNRVLSRQERRQTFNAQDALNRTSVDRLLHLDADEFLWSETDVATLLHEQQDADALTVPNLERAYLAGTEPESLFEGVFRKPVPGRTRRAHRYFPKTARFTTRGLTGHCSGKSFVKSDPFRMAMGIHSPRARKKVTPYITKSVLDQAWILHFDGLTPEHWVNKLLRYAHSGQKTEQLAELGASRRAQIDEVVAHGADHGAAKDLHDRLKVLTPEVYQRWKSHGLIVDLTFDPSPALARFGLQGHVDLSVKRMNAWLAEQSGTQQGAEAA